MSTSTTVKRARVTARIAQAENTSLPTSSEITQHLLEQTEAKRKQLDKKCSDYEQICKRTARLKAEKNRIETENSNLTAQCDEIDQSYDKIEQNAETSFLLQQQKNNEMNEAVQQWSVLDGKEEKLYDDLMHEAELVKSLRKQHEEITTNLHQLGTEAESDEKEFRQLESAFDTDMRTEKTLEQYLTRLIDDVFINQRRLEDIQIGTSRGRANFRQAEKALRDQRTRNRRLSAQISQNTESERVFDDEEEEQRSMEEVQKIEEMEKAWYTLEDKIRLREFELAEESEKVNQKLRMLGKQQFNETADEEKQKQLRIAKDYADLQSHTPMYAAYSASLSLNHNLVEKLEIPESRNSILKEPTTTYKSSQTSGTPNQFVEFEDEIDDFPEYSRMNESRRKILRDTENEAQRVLGNELKKLEGIVSGQRQESQALNRDVKWLKENIQLRKGDIDFYTTKTQELIQKARKEDHDKLQSAQHKSQNSFPLDLVSSRGDVLELREKRLILENERNILANQIKDNSLDCDRLDEQWKILKGFAKSVNFDSIKQLDMEIENWRIKVTQLDEQIAKLEKMENYASLANGQLRTNLALLKPYDEEYQEFEHLLETNKLLHHQVERQVFRRSVEELKQSGDIDIVL